MHVCVSRPGVTRATVGNGVRVPLFCREACRLQGCGESSILRPGSIARRLASPTAQIGVTVEQKHSVKRAATWRPGATDDDEERIYRRTPHANGPHSDEVIDHSSGRSESALSESAASSRPLTFGSWTSEAPRFT
jgi:hypothetical protein